MAKIKNILTESEFEHVVKKYEEIGVGYWLPTHVPEQTLWITAWEEGKLYFKGDNQKDSCDHEFVSADNQVVTGAEVCIKCKTIRAKE